MTMHPWQRNEKRSERESRWDNGPPDMANSQLFHVCAQFCKKPGEANPFFLFCCCILVLIDDDRSGLLLVCFPVNPSISYPAQTRTGLDSVRVHDCTYKFPIHPVPSSVAIRPSHPSSPIQPSISLCCGVSASTSHPRSLAASVSIWTSLCCTPCLSIILAATVTEPTDLLWLGG